MTLSGSRENSPVCVFFKTSCAKTKQGFCQRGRIISDDDYRCDVMLCRATSPLSPPKHIRSWENFVHSFYSMLGSCCPRVAFSQ